MSSWRRLLWCYSECNYSTPTTATMTVIKQPHRTQRADRIESRKAQRGCAEGEMVEVNAITCSFWRWAWVSVSGSGWAGVVFHACNPISISIYYGWRVETGQPCTGWLRSEIYWINALGTLSVYIWFLQLNARAIPILILEGEYELMA